MQWRRLKTATSARVIPLWPQLREILERYLNSRTARMVLEDAPAGTLLFPSFATGAEARLVDLRKIFDRVAMRAGWKAGEVRSRALRHTYCSARLQTLDNGAPVSAFQVAREMGHGGDSLVRRIYGHLGEIRHRVEVVEYRVESYRALLASGSQRSSGADLLPLVLPRSDGAREDPSTATRYAMEA